MHIENVEIARDVAFDCFRLVVKASIDHRDHVMREFLTKIGPSMTAVDLAHAILANHEAKGAAGGGSARGPSITFKTEGSDLRAYAASGAGGPAGIGSTYHFPSVGKAAIRIPDEAATLRPTVAPPEPVDENPIAGSW